MMKLIAILATVAGAWLFAAWILMLIVGIIHLNWIPQLPTIGYPLALLITILLGTRATLSAYGAGLIRNWANDETRTHTPLPAPRVPTRKVEW